MPKEVLLTIDPQVDFCEGGNLAVAGGRNALENVAGFIERYGHNLDDIVITLDSHHPLHIAHAMWWNEGGNEPGPFTTVQLDGEAILFGTLDENGSFHSRTSGTTAHPGFRKWTVEYLKKLIGGGRYPHMIWPTHCLIGYPGATILEPVRDAVERWERKQFGVAQMVTKGSNIKTEHFGALRAEVEDPDDVGSTGVNSHFLELLSGDDTIVYGTGLALSHCLANTARDTAGEFDADTFCKRFVLLEDCTASVAGLEHLGEQFVADFKSRGMRVAKSTEI